jgi:hypothetical protein
MEDNYDSSDSEVSIHSIVTDNGNVRGLYLENIDSDNEAPEDKTGQSEKIIKNHVVKTIVKVLIILR